MNVVHIHAWQQYRPGYEPRKLLDVVPTVIIITYISQRWSNQQGQIQLHSPLVLYGHPACPLLMMFHGHSQSTGRHQTAWLYQHHIRMWRYEHWVFSVATGLWATWPQYVCQSMLSPCGRWARGQQRCFTREIRGLRGEEWKGYSLDNGVMTSNKQFQTQRIASRFDRDLQLGANELITGFITQLYLILLVSLEVRVVMMAIWAYWRTGPISALFEDDMPPPASRSTGAFERLACKA